MKYDTIASKNEEVSKHHKVCLSDCFWKGFYRKSDSSSKPVLQCLQVGQISKDLWLHELQMIVLEIKDLEFLSLVK
jgi:hypothetical protein